MTKTKPTWTKKTILIAAIGIYLITFIINPTKAKESLIYTLQELKKLTIPLLTAIFAGTTLKTLITPNLITKIFKGKKGILAAGTIGSILPPCPYISYPTINGLKKGGLTLPTTLTMLTTTTTVETGQIFCGLAIFGPTIVSIRITFAFLASVIVGTIFFFLHTQYHTIKQNPEEKTLKDLTPYKTTKN